MKEAAALSADDWLFTMRRHTPDGPQTAELTTAGGGAATHEQQLGQRLRRRRLCRQPLRQPARQRHGHQPALRQRVGQGCALGLLTMLRQGGSVSLKVEHSANELLHAQWTVLCA